MTFAYGPAWAKREAIRRRQRTLGIYAVPKPEVLDRIVAEHEAAAALGIEGHDETCERVVEAVVAGPSFLLVKTPCYCPERRDALERIARRLDAATNAPLASDESVTTEPKEGPR